MSGNSLVSHPFINSYFEAVSNKFGLTPRESEVLRALMILGPNNRELGDLLDVSEKTMKNHIANILKKTKTNSTRELQALVFRETLVPVLLSVFQATNNHPAGKPSDRFAGLSIS